MVFQELFDGPTNEDHGGTECLCLTEKPAPRKVRILSEAAARALYAQAKAGNNAGRKELIERFWPLCHKFAKQCRGDLTHDDETSAAVTALMSATDRGRFDPTKLDKHGKPIKLATILGAAGRGGQAGKTRLERHPHIPPTSAGQSTMDAPEATVNAVEYELRTNGEASFATPGCQRRLAALSAAQVFELIARLARQRPKYPAITNEVLSRLGEHAG